MDAPDTAALAANRAFEQVLAALAERRNFRLEAGAGAGKTTALRRTVRAVLDDRSRYLPRPDQQIACMTFTNVARDEILKDTDTHPAVFVDTIHGFLWAMISPFQKAMRAIILESDDWKTTLQDTGTLDGIAVDYELGYRAKTDRSITLRHDDVPKMAAELFGRPKFRQLIADRYPIIFIDEYQDTHEGLIEAMLGDDPSPSPASPVFGFFGDHWQQIYSEAGGAIEHPSVRSIPVNANFRSDKAIVGFLNRLRPELVQAPASGAATGTVTVYHTNAWSGQRGKGHQKGQIAPEAATAVLSWVLAHAPRERWGDASLEAKTLMLTNTAIAKELGYGTIAAAFRDSEPYIKKTNEVITYLVDIIEPAVDAFAQRRYGALFTALNQTRPTLGSNRDKHIWSDFFTALTEVSKHGSIGDVLDMLDGQHLFNVPKGIRERNRQLAIAIAQSEGDDAEALDSKLERLQRLRAAPFQEIRALKGYIEEQTDFSTSHGVKGAEFDNVIAVMSRSWAKYNFAEMLATHPRRASLNDVETARYERSRNLFYVAASRARRNLVLLFTQGLDAVALATLTDLAGEVNIFSIDFNENTPIGIQA